VFKKHICFEINLCNGGFSFEHLVTKVKPLKREKKHLFDIKNIIDNLVQKRKNKKGLVYFIGSLDKVIEIVIVEITFNYLMVFPNTIHTSRIKFP